MKSGSTCWRIGHCGWSYPDWAGVVLPARPGRGFKPLSLLARLFNTVEVNTSFYRTPTPETTAAWARLVGANFRFAVKLNRAFTHERGAFPPTSEVSAFRRALQPLAESGRLGPLLIQFPWSFRYAAGAADWLARLREAFESYERFVEVRHASWRVPEALALLRMQGGYCNIDQPALRDCLPLTANAWGATAYFRLHGRNQANWFAEGLPPFERYNYLYSQAELAQIVAQIRAAANSAQTVYVFTNNHYRGQGLVNALELRALLEGGRFEVPGPLQAAYPRLAQIAATPPQEPTLFD